jgi:hypothetical protein
LREAFRNVQRTSRRYERPFRASGGRFSTAKVLFRVAHSHFADVISRFVVAIRFSAPPFRFSWLSYGISFV